MKKRHRYSFQALLVYLLALILLSPVLMGGFWGSVILEGAFTGLLGMCLYTVSYDRFLWWPALFLAVPAVVFSWIEVFFPGLSAWVYLSFVLKVLFFSSLSIGFLYQIFHEKNVTLDTVFGAMCGYIILGLVWAFSYTLLEWARPGSFEGVFANRASLGSEEVLRLGYENFQYYSLVTLSTLGYGDLLPISAQARAFAVVETLLGQFYLAVFLGRMIGISLQVERRKIG